MIIHTIFEEIRKFQYGEVKQAEILWSNVYTTNFQIPMKYVETGSRDAELAIGLTMLFRLTGWISIPRRLI